MNTQKKNLNLNNVPESLIRQVRAAAAVDGKTIYAWAIEAFQEKIDFDQARDPRNVTERLVNAIHALGSSAQEHERLQAAFTTIVPLLVTDFPAHVQEEFAAIMDAWRAGSIKDSSSTTEKLLSMLLKIWGPTWYK